MRILNEEKMKKLPHCRFGIILGVLTIFLSITPHLHADDLLLSKGALIFKLDGRFEVSKYRSLADIERLQRIFVPVGTRMLEIISNRIDKFGLRHTLVITEDGLWGFLSIDRREFWDEEWIERFNNKKGLLGGCAFFGTRYADIVLVKRPGIGEKTTKQADGSNKRNSFRYNLTDAFRLLEDRGDTVYAHNIDMERDECAYARKKEHFDVVLPRKDVVIQKIERSILLHGADKTDVAPLLQMKYRAWSNTPISGFADKKACGELDVAPNRQKLDEFSEAVVSALERADNQAVVKVAREQSYLDRLSDRALDILTKSRLNLDFYVGSELVRNWYISENGRKISVFIEVFECGPRTINKQKLVERKFISEDGFDAILTLKSLNNAIRNMPDGELSDINFNPDNKKIILKCFDDYDRALALISTFRSSKAARRIVLDRDPSLHFIISRFAEVRNFDSSGRC